MTFQGIVDDLRLTPAETLGAAAVVYMTRLRKVDPEVWRDTLAFMVTQAPLPKPTGVRP